MPTSRVDRTSPVSRAGRTSPVSKVVSNANFKIKGPANARPFLMGGTAIQPLRRLPLAH